MSLKRKKQTTKGNKDLVMNKMFQNRKLRMECTSSGKVKSPPKFKRNSMLGRNLVFRIIILELYTSILITSRCPSPKVMQHVLTCLQTITSTKI
jgi:hypothetical protein